MSVILYKMFKQNSQSYLSDQIIGRPTEFTTDVGIDEVHELLAMKFCISLLAGKMNNLIISQILFGDMNKTPYIFLFIEENLDRTFPMVRTISW